MEMYQHDRLWKSASSSLYRVVRSLGITHGGHELKVRYESEINTFILWYDGYPEDTATLDLSLVRIGNNSFIRCSSDPDTILSITSFSIRLLARYIITAY